MQNDSSEGMISLADSRRRAREPDRGRNARTPWAIPGPGLRDVLWRVYLGIFRDRIGANAAGTAFYLVLALVPSLAALVSLYGLIADPVTIRAELRDLQGYLPSAMIDIMDAELVRLVGQRTDSLGLTFATTLFFAIWIVNSAVQGLFDALNAIYGEEEKRGYVRLYATSFGFTLGALGFIIVALHVIVGVPVVISLLPLGRLGEILVAVLPAVVLFCVAAIGIAALFRYGPSRRPAQWRWISPGSVSAATVWVMASAAFSYYLSNFANYTATYGSLGAIAGVMMWAYISMYILLVAAEIDAEIEHQTAADTTTDGPRPLGRRGAVMADSVGPSREELAATGAEGEELRP